MARLYWKMDKQYRDFILPPFFLYDNAVGKMRLSLAMVHLRISVLQSKFHEAHMFTIFTLKQ